MTAKRPKRRPPNRHPQLTTGQLLSLLASTAAIIDALARFLHE